MLLLRQSCQEAVVGLAELTVENAVGTLATNFVGTAVDHRMVLEVTNKACSCVFVINLK
jgi:hypothetical protein